MDITPYYGTCLKSTGEVKNLLATLFPTLPAKGWKRKGKRKEGLNIVREFEHAQGDRIEVATQNDKLVSINEASDEPYDTDTVFQPSQCYFAIAGEHVYIEPKAHWREEHCLNDFVGGHSFEASVLTACGVCDTEDSEACFSILEGDAATVKALMEKAGFTHSPDLEEFLSDGE